MILDKLLEKKDLSIYIDKRIAHLERMKKKAMSEKSNVPLKKRPATLERFNGKIQELKYLKKHINDVKSQAKRFWREEAWRSEMDDDNI
jgi:hypothetical protein